MTLAILLGIPSGSRLTSRIGVEKLYSKIQMEKHFAVFCKKVLQNFCERGCESLHAGLLPREKCCAEANRRLTYSVNKVRNKEMPRWGSDKMW